MKRALASIIVLGIWMWFCSYWYVCGVKGLCEEKEVPAGGIVMDVEPPIVEEKILEPEPEPVVIEKPKPEPLVLKKVYFVFNTTLIKNLSALDSNIKPILDYIEENPESMVYLTGHTCDIGAERNNFGLGIKRGEAVRDYLMENGVPDKLIIIDSKGSESPGSDGDTDTDRMYNRRVEVIVKPVE